MDRRTSSFRFVVSVILAMLVGSGCENEKSKSLRQYADGLMKNYQTVYPGVLKDWKIQDDIDIVTGSRGETSGRVTLVLMYATGDRDEVKIDARWNNEKKRWESQEEANLIFSNIARLTRQGRQR